MAENELLVQFRTKVDEFAKYRAFIDKAQAQADKFAAHIVEKVIRDNTEKSLGVVADLIPLTDDLESAIAALAERRTERLEGVEQTRFDLEVLQLRNAIGEISDEEYAGSAAPLEEEIGRVDTEVAELDQDLEACRSAVERWTTLGQEAGVLQ